MGANLKRFLNYWFPKTIGTLIISYQFYKYVKVQINSDNYVFEGFVFVAVFHFL